MGRHILRSMQTQLEGIEGCVNGLLKITFSLKCRTSNLHLYTFTLTDCNYFYLNYAALLHDYLSLIHHYPTAD